MKKRKGKQLKRWEEKEKERKKSMRGERVNEKNIKRGIERRGRGKEMGLGKNVTALDRP